MEVSKFRVIIVGAGPVGLYLAQALSLARIDFIVLEQQSTITNFGGQLIFTWPQTVRLLDQLGLYTQVKEVGVEINEKKRVFGGDGHVMTSTRFWQDMKDNHAYPFLLIPRGKLVEILYQNLPEKDKRVRANSKVIDIIHHANGIDVHLQNGHVENGSIVIGADGVHSQTRLKMLEAASQSGLDISIDENAMAANFHGIFGSASNKELRLEEGIVFESRGAGAVIQCVATPSVIYYVTLKALDSPSTKRTRYTPGQMEEHAEEVGDVALCPGHIFRDLWKYADKEQARKLNQEEGILKNWSWGRIVLVGDSVHKTTSVNGLGLTCGLHSAAALANEITRIAGAEKEVDIEEIGGAFKRYQNEREAEARQIQSDGHKIIRDVTSKRWISRFWDEWVLPWIDIEKFWGGRLVSLFLVRHGQILEFVPFKGEEGKVGWARKPNVKAFKLD
ncbi:FAD/NAD(P)-binding domain-containing protein [Bisporella sp. PMI_857]|nr:FAD/NAD(P)-binding domain-containing protein [Bisporella sp. PMI_857]